MVFPDGFQQTSAGSDSDVDLRGFSGSMLQLVREAAPVVWTSCVGVQTFLCWYLQPLVGSQSSTFGGCPLIWLLNLVWGRILPLLVKTPRFLPAGHDGTTDFGKAPFIPPGPETKAWKACLSAGARHLVTTLKVRRIWNTMS